jgi:hypothetical protein
MGESKRLESFAEDLAIFRQLITPAERAEFSHLMKRAYAQQMSACAFVLWSPERQVSERIRCLCALALSPASTQPACDPEDKPGADGEDGTMLTA